MYPILFKIGPVTVSTYGVLCASGVLAANAVACWLAARSGIAMDRFRPLAWWTALAGMAGARLFHVIGHAPHYLAHPLEILRFWDGWAFLGGPIGAFIFILAYTRWYRLPTLKVLDIMAVSIALGHTFGRIGCFFAGCCHGTPTGTWLGVRLYSEHVDPSYRGIPIHPTQLYMAWGSLLLFFILLRVFERRSFAGQVVLVYFMIYPVERSILEIFRGDESRGFVVPGVLSHTQFVSVFVFLAAVTALVIRLKSMSRTRSDPVLS